MFCSNCGTSIKENDGFCTVCRWKVPAKEVIVEKKQKTEPDHSVESVDGNFFWSFQGRKEREVTVAKYEKEYLKRLDNQKKENSKEQTIKKAEEEEAGKEEPKKEEMSAFCDNCGKSLRPTAKFCGSCGTSVP